MKTEANPDIEERFSNLNKSIKNQQAEIAKFVSTLPASVPCQVHPQVTRLRDDRKSWQAGKTVFAKCGLCEAEKHRQAEFDRLHARGIPLNLCSATFENWEPDGEDDEANLEKVREFSQIRRGFLILLGGLGTGKSHLAVAAFRMFNRGLFIKQSDLLRRLRQTYRDKAAVDPVDEAQNAGCLVLDEMGLSPGGRDELPLLHDVLDHRHGNQKPTILTGNLTLDEMCVVIGDRMADRIRESAFAILYFGGVSRRREARKNYFQAPHQRRL